MRRIAVYAIIALIATTAAMCEPVYYRAADGSWKSMEAPTEDGRLKIHITAENAPDGNALLVINKPDWMVLDDQAPPELVGLKANGNPRPAAMETMHLGTLGSESLEAIIAVKDEKNPLSPESLQFSLSSHPEAVVDIQPGEIGPPKTSARIVVNVSNLSPGAYRGDFRISDLGPLANTLHRPVEFTIFGITVAEDGQSVILANSVSDFTLKPHKSDQLSLPNQWAKLTTNVPGDFLYPREFTDVEIIEHTPERRTVQVTANTMNIDEKPVEGMVELQYTLTVRPDTPALQVVSRSINISDETIGINPNWGWLRCPYYHTPEGRAEWISGADPRYSTIGKVNWLWLAPRNENNPGLLWVSPHRFGEFTGGSILLYGPKVDAKKGEFSEMHNFFAPADSPEEAREIYDDLVEKGLYTPVQQEG